MDHVGKVKGFRCYAELICDPGIIKSSQLTEQKGRIHSVFISQGFAALRVGDVFDCKSKIERLSMTFTANSKRQK